MRLDDIIKNLLSKDGDKHYCRYCESYEKGAVYKKPYCSYLFRSCNKMPIVIDYNVIINHKNKYWRLTEETDCPNYNRKRLFKKRK